MSRIGKLPITIPTGVEVKLDGRNFSAKGPKGELALRVARRIEVTRDGEVLTVKPTVPDERALWGLTRTLVANLLTGVSEGYQKELEIHGVGYKAQVNGDKLTLNLGFSHPIEYSLHTGIAAQVEGSKITLSGADKQLVGQAAAEIRDFRRPEPYKGKGIRYVGEHVRRKAGKAAGKAES